jgi:hypothetical protein
MAARFFLTDTSGLVNSHLNLNRFQLPCSEGLTMRRAQWWRTVRQLWRMAARHGRRTVQRSRPSVEILERRLAPAVTLSISNPVPFPKSA